jgi:hypothetical protein
MANATPTRFGSINSGDDGTFANDYALFLKVWAGEVLSAFEELNITMPLHRVLTIPTGKTAQFIATGKATAGYHAVGTQLLGTNDIYANEVTINVDRPLLADVFIANFDEIISQYDAKSEFSKQLARSIAVKFDKHVLQKIVLTARASANVSGGNGGTALTDASIETDGEALYNMLFDAQQAMDEKDVPSDERYCALKPAQFKLLGRYTKIHNGDWGGTGTIADGDVGKIAGFQMLKTNHLPTTNISVESPAPHNTYHADFSNTLGVCWQKAAVGTVKVRDMAMESEYDVSRQGTLLVAKIVCGHGSLRPECAVEMKKA